MRGCRTENGDKPRFGRLVKWIALRVRVLESRQPAHASLWLREPEGKR